MAQCKRRLNTIKSNETVHIINNALAQNNPPPWELVQAPVQIEKQLVGREETDSEQHDLRKGKCIKCGCTEAAIQTYKCTCREPSITQPPNMFKQARIENSQTQEIQSYVRSTIMTGVVMCIIGAILSPILIGIPILLFGLFCMFAPSIAYKYIFPKASSSAPKSFLQPPSISKTDLRITASSYDWDNLSDMEVAKRILELYDIYSYLPEEEAALQIVSHWNGHASIEKMKKVQLLLANPEAIKKARLLLAKQSTSSAPESYDWDDLSDLDVAKRIKELIDRYSDLPQEEAALKMVLHWQGHLSTEKLKRARLILAKYPEAINNDHLSDKELILKIREVAMKIVPELGRGLPEETIRVCIRKAGISDERATTLLALVERDNSYWVEVMAPFSSTKKSKSRQ